MVDWPTPSTLKQLRGFLVLPDIFQTFYSALCADCNPLTDLLKKDVFQWSATADVSFANLKTKAPVLRVPDFTRTFYVEIDASDFGIGAVLQDMHPLAFFSKKLGPHRRRAFTYYKELYAIV